jgi:hypothetical protein
MGAVLLDCQGERESWLGDIDGREAGFSTARLRRFGRNDRFVDWRFGYCGGGILTVLALQERMGPQGVGRRDLSRQTSTAVR